MVAGGVIVVLAAVGAYLIWGHGNAMEPSKEATANAPVFSLAWSEYPSWSVFGVAHSLGLIDGRPGHMGPLEKKWGVDIELKEADYDTCIQLYLSGQVDAACLTNMDVLNPCLSRDTVAILPTSTSYGADALIVPKSITSVQSLKGKNVYGLKRSVSEYFFYRVIEDLGQNAADYNFTNMDPLAASQAYQQNNPAFPAIVVWHPFVLETLNKRTDSHRLFDSKKIPAEIIDMVQMAQSSLDRPGGKQFACLIIDTYYTVNRILADPKRHDDTVVALGEKFSNLDLKSMEQVLTDCRFFSTPEAGLALLKGEDVKIYTDAAKTTSITPAHFKDIMPKVVKFCVSHQIVDKEPTVAFGDRSAAGKVNLRLDPAYIQAYLDEENGAGK
ncbi:MAG: hypothetical protein ABSB42_10210 [Tepidisphaeraceae bacterium]|jgi:NitT/TauT family transport system substrate-binding protein